jgi:type II secretory pathway pseudopilin PulG
MSSAGAAGRYWRSLRGLPDRTPLRVKMITALLALVIVALAVVGFASRAVFSGYLMRQAETRLTSYNQQVQRELNQGHLDYRNGFLSGGVEQVWLLTSSGQEIGAPPAGTFGTSTPPPQVPLNQAWLTANQGKEVTEPDQDGDN